MWDYISAVCGYWQFWVAVAFFAERAAERFFPRSWSWAEPYLTHDRRRWAFLGIAIIAFVYANFRAFDAERSRNQTLAAQLRFTTLGSGDPRPDGRPDGVKLGFTNGGSLPSIGLIFEHKFAAFDHQLTDIDQRSEMAKVKQTADKKHDTLTEFEEQPGGALALLATDPEDILMRRKDEEQDHTYYRYLFAVVEYRDRMLPPNEFWVTEVCLEMPPKRPTINCPTDNKIYRSK
jgi:hypothetical protein